MNELYLYWSFRGPYSYIVLPRIMALRQQYRVTIELRVVHPAALRNPDYFTRMDPLARPYFMLDSARAAAFVGRRPTPVPIPLPRTRSRWQSPSSSRWRGIGRSA